MFHPDQESEVQAIHIVNPETSASERYGIPVLIAPYRRELEGPAADTMEIMAYRCLLIPPEREKQHKEDDVAWRKKWLMEMRGWLMVVATVVVSVTYQAGLNPPGGFWQADDGDGHRAGNPVMRDALRPRYLAFYYLNATAFVTSIVIVALLIMSERFYHTEVKVVTLMLTTVVDLASLIGAYIAGSTRYSSSCVFIVVITCAAFVGVLYMARLMPRICGFPWNKFRCCPANLKYFTALMQLGEGRIQGRMASSRRPPCSPCGPPSVSDDRVSG